MSEHAVTALARQTQARPAWAFARVGFRFVCCYWLLYCVPGSVLSRIPGAQFIFSPYTARCGGRAGKLGGEWWCRCRAGSTCGRQTTGCWRSARSTTGIVTLDTRDLDTRDRLAWSRPDGDHLVLEGTLDGSAATLRLRKVDTSKFLRLSRGFHWINEMPLNR
jgi:hypothetical protein